MKILVSWSSGKDSAWMLHVLRTTGIGTPAALLTSINEQFDRVAMHGVRSAVLRAQAAAAGLPLVTVPLPYPCPNEVYEQRMRHVVMAAVAGLLSMVFAVPFMTGLWIYPVVLGVEIPLSSVMLFDTGVYLVVVGSITSIALALEAEEDI